VVKIVHSLVMIECDSEQHRRIVESMNRRKYHFKSTRDGYCRPHFSEVKLYDIRAKKEVMPHILQDIGVETFMPKKKIKLWHVIRRPRNVTGKDCFFDGRGKLLARYVMQRLGKFIRLECPDITEAKDRKAVPPVEGWYYAFHVGNIKDIDRGWGEEL